MSSTGVGCLVYIDGERLPDGTPGDNPLDPTALSGLRVKWGRETTIDQPEPNTCTFSVMDERGGEAFMSLLRTGRRVDVYASGTFYPDDPTAPMFEDPSFEAAAVGTTPPSVRSRARVRVTDTRSATGGGPAAWTETRRNYALGSHGYMYRSTGNIARTYPASGTTRVEWTTNGNAAWWDALQFHPAVSAAGGRTPISPGQTARGAVQWRSIADLRRVRGVIAFYDAANVVIGSSIIANDPQQPAVGEWSTPFEFTAVAPAGAAQFSLYIGSTQGSPVASPAGFEIGDGYEFRNIMVTINDPGPFIDGSTVSADPRKRYAWTGAVDASPSIEETNTANLGHSALVTPTDAAGSGSVSFAPAPLSTSPDAWDDLTPTNPGTLWKVGASVFGPPGASVTVSPVRFARPDGGAIVIEAGTTVTTDGTWQIVAMDYRPQVFGQWVGVAVTVSGFARWIDVPGAWVDQPADWAWADEGTIYVDDLVVTAPEGGTVRTVEVFSGRITDLVAAWDDSADAPVVNVTAQDFTADMANIDVGDEPWAVEAMADRFNRIVTLTGQPVGTIIDDTLSGVLVSWQDVDAQSSMNLLRDLAQSVDGVLWSAVHATTGAYLWVEDPSGRAGLYTLAVTDGIIYIVPAQNIPDALSISACDVLRDPVEWRQDVADVSTRVAVSWLEQTTNDDGEPDPTERTVTVIDDVLEIDYGKRRISVSTILQSQNDALAVANSILGRTHVTDWRASGFSIDDDDSLSEVDADTVTMFLDLLDGTARIGMPLRIIDLPDWSPSGPVLPAYLEGGEYGFDDGAWTLNLIVSHATAIGQSSAWVDMDAAWQWVQFDPNISWLDMAGVRYPDE